MNSVPPPVAAGAKNLAPLLISLAIAVLVLVPFLGTIPGLNGDEAWAGVRAHEILGGRRPMVGMTWYAGPVQQYLMAPGLAEFGFRVSTLRLFTVVNSLVFVILYYSIARRLFDARAAGLSVLCLVTLPAFAAYGRPAYEVFALNPVLAAAAISLLLHARERPPLVRSAFWLFAGVCLGLGTWNHLIFLSVPCALLVCACSSHRFGILWEPSLYFVGYGLALALAPRLYFEFSGADRMAIRLPGLEGGDFLGLLFQRLREWPLLLAQMVHGDPAYRRFAGEVKVSLPEPGWFALAGGVVAHLRKHGPRCGMPGIQVSLFASSLFFATLFLCPKNSDRYFLLIVYCFPVFVGLSFSKMLALAAWRRWVAAFLVVYLTAQLGRTGINYFGSQLRSHGRVSAFQFGSEPETSNSYIRTDELYNQLARLGATRIYAEFFIAMPLRFYDLEAKRLLGVQIVDAPGAARAVAAANDASYAVVYSSGLRRVCAEDYAGFEQVAADEHFIVLRSPGPALVPPPKQPPARSSR